MWLPSASLSPQSAAAELSGLQVLGATCTNIVRAGQAPSLFPAWNIQCRVGSVAGFSAWNAGTPAHPCLSKARLVNLQ